MASFWKRSACEQRTLYDLEMMNEVGYCSGIEELLALPLRARAG
jgi:excinuclease UvrABC helicase subunit UvrB